MRAQRGEEVTFLTSDEVKADFANVNRLEAAGYIYRSHNEIVRIYGDTLTGFGVPSLLFVTENPSVSKTLLHAVGGFDPQFQGWGCEDSELGYRLHERGARFYCAPAATAYHQIHPGGAMGDVAVWREHARNYLRFCHKHPRLEIYLFWRFVVGELSYDGYSGLVNEHRHLVEQHEEQVFAEFVERSRRQGGGVLPHGSAHARGISRPSRARFDHVVTPAGAHAERIRQSWGHARWPRLVR